MKKILTLALLACLAMGANAQEKKESANKNKPVFTTIKECKITSIKDQSRSGTCWDYSTLSFFESEIFEKDRQERRPLRGFCCKQDLHGPRYHCSSHAW